MSHFPTFTRQKVCEDTKEVIRSNKFDTNVQLPTRLYENRDDFNFAAMNFPYLDSNIPTVPVTLYSDCLGSGDIFKLGNHMTVKCK